MNCILFSLLLLASSINATNFYVSTSGSDSNTGVISGPYRTIQKAINTASAGDTIYIRAGTYSLTTNIQIVKSGTSASRITLTNYGSEKVIIDGESLPYTPGDVGSSIPSASRGTIHMSASYWNIIGLEIKNGPYGVYCDGCNNNLFERLITHDNYETGFQLQGKSSNNHIKYLDSYRNRDPRKNGESADGLGIKEGSGTGNKVTGARLYENSDDGLDFWKFESTITVVDCVSWGNGVNRWGFSNFAGDGNGFKLGGSGVNAAHSVSNSIAFSNAVGGFVDNSNAGAHSISGNTAWENTGGTGFAFSNSLSTLKSNLAVRNKVIYSLKSGGTSSGNSWQDSSVSTWSNSLLLSVDTTAIKGSRNADGTIKAGSNFLRPSNGKSYGAKFTS
ncbi:hypothetical protein HK096_009164 [Nowakowskiella sp. JEL0078]|nr:hypothetical protein HK096_009164 [Nowakowskiella sp. JEL0078]